VKTIIQEMVEDEKDVLQKQRSLEIAKKLKARGDSIDEIIRITDLTVDDILPL
jgi:3,4-dihydroxy-2-butanone 4-phosphate synthase